MGCVASKKAVTDSPAFEYSVTLGDNGAVILEPSLKNPSRSRESEEKKESENPNRDLGKLSKVGSNGKCSLSFRLGNVNKYAEGEQVAAGWPSWLSTVAAEAIQGWVPLRSDSFEKLEKIGQGTYSSVFRARNVETGKMVALKKVRFDNFQPESIRFMAREILILRRLNHPNIMKLEGLITSRLSCSMYLVFEYMEHDLAGLLSSPDIKFSDSQVKCYMKQLLCGLEHCHLRGIMHRDVKVSNILINNEGVLKVADFGLANTFNPGKGQQLTSRVVTLWYRPPELLLGSTNYGVSVDLWSVGCVFAELLIGKPILKGRTEVEQLHKIFKLCGSPPEEYWKKAKLPHATMFKPQHPYESSLRERYKEFPTTAVNLIETFLSIEPRKRGTASSALMSEYFKSKPYACDPSSLPKYPPNKEMDAKCRDDARRKKAGLKPRVSGASRKPRRVLKPLQEPNISPKLAPKVEVQSNNQFANRSNSINAHIQRERGGAACRESLKSSLSDLSQVTSSSQGDIPFSGPLQVAASSGFAWAKRRKGVAASTKSYGSRCSSLDPWSVLNAKNSLNLKKQESGDILYDLSTDSRGHDAYEVAKHAMRQRQRTQFEHSGSFDASDPYHSQELSAALYDRDEEVASKDNLGHNDQQGRVEFSGPLSSQSYGLDEIFQRRESLIRQALRQSRLQRGTSMLNF